MSANGNGMDVAHPEPLRLGTPRPPIRLERRSGSGVRLVMPALRSERLAGPRSSCYATTYAGSRSTTWPTSLYLQPHPHELMLLNHV